MKREKWLVHGIAECRTCGWSHEDYLLVQRRAREHATKTGHPVTVELGYVVQYGATKEE